MRLFNGAPAALILLLGVSCSDGEDDPDAGVAAEAGVLAEAGVAADAEVLADAEVFADAEVAADATTAPVFIDPATYADVLALDDNFPFGVVARYAADGDVLGARWGRHGGPMVTTQVYVMPAGDPGVIRWTIPETAGDPATKTELVFATADNLPAQFFYGPDGMVDLPYGAYALLSYSGTGPAFPGEALLYNENYDAVASRAHANGFYSGAGFGQRGLVYSGLSGLSGEVSATEDNGLWAAELCSDSLVPSGGCRASVKLFGWTGSSGPVAVDTNGNAFVAAYQGLPGASDAIFAVTAADLAAFAPAMAATLTEVDTQGTGSIAAVAPSGSAPGWLVAKGFDFAGASPAYAVAYSVDDDVAREGDRVDAAITAGARTESFSLFAAPDGDLWIAVDTSAGNEFFRARRR